MASYPLDPPSRDEFEPRRRSLRTDQGIADSHRFASVELEEPPIRAAYTLALRARQPEFLRGQTLKHDAAHSMWAQEHLVS